MGEASRERLVRKLRAATPAELAQLPKSHEAVGAALFVGGFAAALVWALVHLLDVSPYLPTLAAAVVVTLLMLWVVRRMDGGKRARVRRDRQQGEVEVLELRVERAWELDPHDTAITPALLVELGEGESLLLMGPWLWEAATFGAPAPASEHEAELQFFNGFAPPFAFPTTELTLTRFPHTGRVTAIRLRGEYLAPADGTLLALAERGLAPQSQIVTAGFEELTSQELVGVRVTHNRDDD